VRFSPILQTILAGVLALGAMQQVGVNALITQLESPDAPAITAAGDMLKARGPEVMPALLKALHDNDACQAQVQISFLVRDMQPGNPAPTAALLGVAQGKCKTKPQLIPAFRRQAAFALARFPDTVPALIGLLKNSDATHRHTAVGGFMDVMMSLQAGTPKIDLTPALLEAEKTALAALAAVVKDSDEGTRCGAFNVLTQSQKTPSDPLKAEAARLLEGVPAPKCPAK
jgi:HEAT repeat protein